MLDWLIIGGGVHGTTLSLYLTRRRGVKMDRLRVLDPHERPLALWDHFTRNVGMLYLRSSHAHNLHFDPFSLATFARTTDGLPLAAFIEPYGRPSLALFRAHCDRLIERYRLDSLRVKGRASGLTRLADGWRVETEAGALEARRVILAIGSSEQPYWPDWAGAARQEGEPIHHVFDELFRRDALPEGERVVVIGGGITAAQTAMALALRAPGLVTLISRHRPRLHAFDADTGWVTALYLDSFQREHDYGRRREIIREARHRGSLPADVAGELERATQAGLLEQRLDEVSGTGCRDGKVTLELAHGGLTADRVVLATGFDSRRPGGAWLDAAVSDHGLPCAPDGYPAVDVGLCWAPGLYVSGPLAELEVGPVARNFAGARLAAERIGAAA